MAVRHFQRNVPEGKASEYAEGSYSGGTKDTKIIGKLASGLLCTSLGKSADYEGKSAAAELWMCGFCEPVTRSGILLVVKETFGYAILQGLILCRGHAS